LKPRSLPTPTREAWRAVLRVTCLQKPFACWTAVFRRAQDRLNCLDLNLRPPRPERGALPDCATLRRKPVLYRRPCEVMIDTTPASIEFPRAWLNRRARVENGSPGLHVCATSRVEKNSAKYQEPSMDAFPRETGGPLILTANPYGSIKPLHSTKRSEIRDVPGPANSLRSAWPRRPIHP
jgi:hypothetical protein